MFKKIKDPNFYGPMTISIIVLVFLSLFIFNGVELVKENKKREDHRQSVLKVCIDTCTPYIIDLCYFGDKNNIFIACANDEHFLITKSLKND